MQIPIRVIAVGLLVLIAYGDTRTRRIPNALCLIIAALGAGRLVLADDPIDAGHTLVAAAVTFGAAFLLFWRGIVGGGDAKLVSAMILLIGHREVFNFLVLMSLCGGALALVIVARDIFVRLWPTQCSGRLIAGVAGSGGPTESTVPYGVAVAAAGVITLMLPS